MNGVKNQDLSWKLEMTSTKVKEEKDQSPNNMVPAASLEIKVVEFLESRSQEMEAMRENALLVSTNARVMQQLPRHMRRRAASHNVKRLPRELRSAAEKEMKKSGGASVNKRPSRRHRRRPRNLLKDYERRKRKHVWLETHIWHAKRFHMAEMWGYKIPLHPNDRGVRAAYRDSINRCLIFDLSYYCCIEMIGPQETLLSGLSKLTSQNIAPSFASQRYAQGTREGRTVLYRENSYPFQPLGEVRFLWKPQLESSFKETRRSLWIWTHPASYQRIVEEIKKVFLLTDASGDCKVDLDTGLEINSLNDSLCRFRLVGPESQQILRRVFRSATMPPRDPDSCELPSAWWQIRNGGEEHGLYERQASNWSEMGEFQTPNDLLPSSVYGLVVRDPRAAGQLKKEEAASMYECKKQQSERLECWVSISPIWDQDVRESVKANMMRTHEINNLKSNNLVPGLPLELGLQESRIPILLIQIPGVSETMSPSHGSYTLGTPGYGCGWDIILPSGWSLPFWIALNHCEAHPAGLEELRHITFEQPELLFPDNYPDTPAGAEMNLTGYVNASEKYGRIPPAKRINYKKLKVPTPFHFPWKELLDGWRRLDEHSNTNLSFSSRSESFYCLRDKRCLQLLQMLITESKGQKKKHERNMTSLKKNLDLSLLQEIRHDPCLVPVHLIMLDRGALGKFSMICSPEDGDFSKYLKSPDCPGVVDETGLRMRRRTNKSKKRKPEANSLVTPSVKKQKLEIADVKEPDKASTNLLAQSAQSTDSEKREAIKDLPSVGDVVHCCSKIIVGYVTSESGLSYSKGRGSALGFVSVQGLLSVTENQKRLYAANNNACEEKDNDGRIRNKKTLRDGVIVLVRSTRSEHYRFARLNILHRSL